MSEMVMSYPRWVRKHGGRVQPTLSSQVWWLCPIHAEFASVVIVSEPEDSTPQHPLLSSCSYHSSCCLNKMSWPPPPNNNNLWRKRLGFQIIAHHCRSITVARAWESPSHDVPRAEQSREGMRTTLICLFDTWPWSAGSGRQWHNENDFGDESSLFINSNMKDVTLSWEYIHL